MPELILPAPTSVVDLSPTGWATYWGEPYDLDVSQITYIISSFPGAAGTGLFPGGGETWDLIFGPDWSDITWIWLTQFGRFDDGSGAAMSEPFAGTWWDVGDPESPGTTIEGGFRFPLQDPYAEGVYERGWLHPPWGFAVEVISSGNPTGRSVPTLATPAIHIGPYGSPIVDSFDRADEVPLDGGGLWVPGYASGAMPSLEASAVVHPGGSGNVSRAAIALASGVLDGPVEAFWVMDTLGAPDSGDLNLYLHSASSPFAEPSPIGYNVLSWQVDETTRHWEVFQAYGDDGNDGHWVAGLKTDTDASSAQSVVGEEGSMFAAAAIGSAVELWHRPLEGGWQRFATFYEQGVEASAVALTSGQIGLGIYDEWPFDEEVGTERTAAFGGGELPGPSDLFAGLVARWPFDEESGTAVEDVVGDNDGVITSGGSGGGRAASLVPSLPGRSVVLDGFDDIVTIGHSSELTGFDEFTIGLVVNQTNAGLETLFSKGESASLEYQLTYQGAGGLRFTFINDEFALQEVVGGGVEEDNAYNIIVVYDGSEMRVYVNAVETGSEAASGGILAGTGDLLVGARYLTGTGLEQFFSGEIDELVIASAAMSPPLVTLQHAQTAGQSAPEVGSGSAAVGPGGVTLTIPVNPRWWLTDAYYEYGVASAYGSATASAEVGFGTIPKEHEQALGVLPPGTYHFRGVAVNPNGHAYGPDQVFVVGSPGPGTFPSRIGVA